MEFEATYREHFASIWRAVQRFGVPSRDAGDAAQDVFVIAYRHRDEFQGRSSLRTWLFGIAFRVAAGRRRRAEVQYEALDEAAVAAAAGASSAADAERAALLSLLDRALDRLPLEQRAVLTLFELEGLSGEEIASALEVPLGTVRSRLRLARAAFSRAVRELEGNELSQSRARESGGLR